MPMKKLLLWILALVFVASCGGKADEGATANLSPYIEEDGLCHLAFKGLDITLRLYPGDFFLMGKTFDQGIVRNPSIHAVLQEGFALGTEPVSQELWQAVMGNNPSARKKDGAPVTRVSWEDAVRFTKKLSGKMGLPFRLVTESEWEYAARTDSSVKADVREWCADYFAEKFRDSLYVNPKGPSNGAGRVVRGGHFAKPSDREMLSQYAKAADIGFRIAVSTGDPIPQYYLDIMVNNRPSRETITRLEPETFTVNGVSFRMLPVQGGTFQMGATPEQGKPAQADEYPVHQVSLDNYMMGEFEVTNELWEAVMGARLPQFFGDKYPAGNVSWYHIQQFIHKLNSLTGRTFRLPTEAEWEFAARGGVKSHNTAYSGEAYPWFERVSVFSTDNLQPRPVGSLKPNELGLYDMSGNVWEWCQDLYEEYTEGPQVNPTGPAFKENGRDFRVLRGGSAASRFDDTRITNRYENLANHFKSTMGFRLAL